MNWIATRKAGDIFRGADENMHKTADELLKTQKVLLGVQLPSTDMTFMPLPSSVDHVSDWSSVHKGEMRTAGFCVFLKIVLYILERQDHYFTFSIIFNGRPNYAMPTYPEST